MQIEITIAEAILANKAIDGLKGKDLPNRASYRVGRYQDKFQPIIKRFDEQRNKLIRDKYGAPNPENKDLIEVPADKTQEFIAEVNSMLEMTETIETAQLKVSDFDGVSLPPEFFTFLAKFIVED